MFNCIVSLWINLSRGNWIACSKSKCELGPAGLWLNCQLSLPGNLIINQLVQLGYHLHLGTTLSRLATESLQMLRGNHSTIYRMKHQSSRSTYLSLSRSLEKQSSWVLSRFAHTVCGIASNLHTCFASQFHSIVFFSSLTPSCFTLASFIHDTTNI